MERLILFAIGAVIAGPAWSQGDAKPGNLNDLNIEDLMKVEVVTASRSSETLKDVPAALYVLSSEEIRRSGAKNLPDMLRLIPGVNVAQLDANKWMVSIRGFNSRFSNKLQVLVDGRSIYSPVFSGVFWDTVKFDPDQIDRIEVIRGPGGALWGPNAVNGIINIITKAADQTQGGAASVSAGDRSLHDLYARYGWRNGEQASWRVSVGSERVRQTNTGTAPASDQVEQHRLDIRGDLHPTPRDTWMLAANLTSEHLGGTYSVDQLTPPYTAPMIYRHRAANWSAQAEWTHRRSDTDQSQVRLSLAHVDQNAPELNMRVTTADIGYQRVLSVGDQTRLVYGAGLRQTNDKLTPGPIGNSATPPTRSDTRWNVFGHYERPLNLRTKLTIGALVEGNSVTGLEFQPNVRVLSRLNDESTVWLALARAVRTPSRGDRDLTLLSSVSPTLPVPTQAVLVGNKDFKSESVLSLEAGYRHQPSSKLMVDLAAYYARYADLRSFELVGQDFSLTPLPHGIALVQFQNKLRAETAGVEALVAYQARPNWRLTGTASLRSERFWLAPGSTDQFGSSSAERSGSAPRIQAGIQSRYSISDRWTLDAQALYVGRVYSQSSGFAAPAFLRLDARIGWKATPDMEISLVGQNLLQASHVEGVDVLNSRPNRVARAFYLQWNWKF